MPYIERKIAEGEHQMQDFKYAINDSRKIAITLCAFANTDGGTLLVGVKDNGAIAGVKPEEEVHMVAAAAEMYCRPRVSFQTHVWKSDNRYVLEVIVPPSDERPHAVIDAEGNYKTYIRRGDQNLPAPNVLLEVWRGTEADRPQKYFHTEKEKKIFSTLQNTEGLSISQLMRATDIPKNVMVKLLARFIRWELIEIFFVQDQARYRLK